MGLGLRHAFDSDHVAAITTLVTGGCSPRQAAAVGASWGLGHAMAVVFFGTALLLAGVQVPASMAALFDLLVVGLMIALGVKALRRAPAHAHAPRRWTLRAIGIGLIHGVSGTAAVALLALTRAPSQAHGFVFLLIFSIAATLSMTTLSFLLALPLAAASRRSGKLARSAQVLAGLFSLAVAALVLVETLRGDGLTTSKSMDTSMNCIHERNVDPFVYDGLNQEASTFRGPGSASNPGSTIFQAHMDQ
jgi:high-affinity nickel-transport protein